MSSWRLRAIGFVIVAIVGCAPALQAVCELVCADPGAQSHRAHSAHTNSPRESTTSIAIEHAHHQTASEPRGNEPTAIAAACDRDCCRTADSSSIASVATRAAADTLLAPDSLAPERTAPIEVSLVANHPRGAPPGRSSPASRPLPLRI